jgi:hypothetical protein
MVVSRTGEQDEGASREKAGGDRLAEHEAPGSTATTGLT